MVHTRTAGEVCLELSLTRSPCQESHATTVAIAWLGKWQRHFFWTGSSSFVRARKFDQSALCAAARMDLSHEEFLVLDLISSPFHIVFPLQPSSILGVGSN